MIFRYLNTIIVVKISTATLIIMTTIFVIFNFVAAHFRIPDQHSNAQSTAVVVKHRCIVEFLSTILCHNGTIQYRCRNEEQRKKRFSQNLLSFRDLWCDHRVWIAIEMWYLQLKLHIGFAIKCMHLWTVTNRWINFDFLCWWLELKSDFTWTEV